MTKLWEDIKSEYTIGQVLDDLLHSDFSENKTFVQRNSEFSYHIFLDIENEIYFGRYGDGSTLSLTQKHIRDFKHFKFELEVY